MALLDFPGLLEPDFLASWAVADDRQDQQVVPWASIVKSRLTLNSERSLLEPPVTHLCRHDKSGHPLRVVADTMPNVCDVHPAILNSPRWPRCAVAAHLGNARSAQHQGCLQERLGGQRILNGASLTPCKHDWINVRPEIPD